ncbi:hypothetical protein RHGRI_008032 [Rhododendron griersonianum]|uniref:Protein kinase domain-containing protein n=1 Tax=Rhododendron griersonianum TaxID=479676 RepID=A0AAV6KZW9_9ERIC|nr:hypothetical protein RHGRI_008032 [Rhododendron griersonianum]
MAVSGVEAVLEFLRKNGFSDSESALMEDLLEKSELRSADFERFFFPMLPPPPPPLKIPSMRRRTEAEDVGAGGGDFTNPYGTRNMTGVSSQASSDRLSQFGTARDYEDFDMQNDIWWYNEKDEDYALPPHFGRSDSFTCPSEDKFVTTLEKGEQIDSQLDINNISEGFHTVESSNYLDKPWPFTISSTDDVHGVQCTEYDHLNEIVQHERSVEKDKEGCTVYSCSSPNCICCSDAGIFGTDPKDRSLMSPKIEGNSITCDRSSNNDCAADFKVTADFHISVAGKDLLHCEKDNCKGGNATKVAAVAHEAEVDANEEDGVSEDQLPMLDTNEDEYEVFDLRIIHRKNRTGFEENKDLPIVLNSIIASRYYITEYLGSAAFSKVAQAHDLHTGMDVCLKIIKNDKDFFDQSLDEIKLLKFVNKHDPGDERHILRLYDYFYFQEHLFIVCELLRANLYEFQKYNQESGGECYFTLSRLQLITRQCLEALEYLHHLGIIHCDLKPENILIKSYSRCEIKVIDLGSSCFLTDNLCLYVQSRSYRAPEVILGLPYDQRIDLWSLGCILAELCSGEVLFPNDTLVMALARMIGMLGPIDMEMLEKGQETCKYFTEEYDLYLINEDTNQLEYVIPEESSLEHHMPVSDIGFINFVRDLLEINPQRRPTAREALEHPWLSHEYESNSC